MQEADQDIFELNISFLFKARELAKYNQQKAAIVLGLDEAVMGSISKLSIKEISGIARSEVMLFQPRFHPKFWKEVANGGHGDGHGNSLATRLHALLMAAEEVSEQ